MAARAKKFFGGSGVKDAMKIFTDNENSIAGVDSGDSGHNTLNTHNTHNTHNTFYNNSTSNDMNVPNTDNMNKERKSKRFSLLLRPSILVALNKIARMENNSPTDIINTVLEDYIKTQSALIEKYETLFDEDGRPKI